MIRLCYVVTHALSARLFLRGNLSYFRELGYEVHLVASPGPGLVEMAAKEGARLHQVPMQREVTPGEDVMALSRLVRLFRQIRPQIVVIGTPKAGFLASMAARIVGVPVRIYALHGLRGETARGFKKHVLDCTEKMASACAHYVVSASASLRDLYVKRGHAPAEKVHVLGAGSLTGVSLARFAPVEKSALDRLRSRWGLRAEHRVLGFVGRITRDKGIAEAIEVWRLLRRQWPSLRLLVLGGEEPGDAPPAWVFDALRARDGVIWLGHVEDTACYYQLMEILVFPSRREGMPNAPLEAALSGVPVVGYRVTGMKDAVVHGKTGLLCRVGDRQQLAGAVQNYLANESLRCDHASLGKVRVAQDFAQEVVWANLAAFYQRALRRAQV